jgi:hypothetical protein
MAKVDDDARDASHSVTVPRRGEVERAIASIVNLLARPNS